jgi:glycolate oxidase subunit GlcD
MIPAQALDALANAVGPRWLKTDRAELSTFASDGLPTHVSRPGAVVIPGSREEVLRVLRILHHFHIPFVARGAGTGLSGGALANSEAVLIVLTRLNRILEIDPENRRAVVEPGVVNTRLTAAAEPFGLHYAPDPSSQSACTMGGNVAENAGGPHCLKYGVTTNHVLALEVALPSGELLELGSPNGEPWGPDLVGLFVGSEGTFGIATSIVVRLTPTPRAIRTLLADFAALRTAGEAVTSIIAAGFVPAALEIMDSNSIAIVEASIYGAGYPTDAAAVLLVELDGTDESAVAMEAREVEELLARGGARSVQLASDPERRERLWQGRKKAFGALGRIGSDLVVQDAVVPRSKLPDVLERIGAIAEHHQLSICNVFHAGDGNLHPNISFDGSQPGLSERVRQASSEIMQTCIETGGTITGEHGVGSDKLNYMSLVFNADTLGLMDRVRRVFDPHELANPGKVLPPDTGRER